MATFECPHLGTFVCTHIGTFFTHTHLSIECSLCRFCQRARQSPVIFSQLPVMVKKSQPLDFCPHLFSLKFTVLVWLFAHLVLQLFAIWSKKKLQASLHLAYPSHPSHPDWYRYPQHICIRNCIFLRFILYLYKYKFNCNCVFPN